MKIVKIEDSDRYKVVSDYGVTFSDCKGHGFKSIYAGYRFIKSLIYQKNKKK